MPLLADVIAGTVIQSAWGNSIRDRTVQVFATLAELNAGWPAAPDGAHAWVTGVNRLYVGIGGVWCRCPDYGVHSGTSDAGGTVVVPHAVGKTPSFAMAISGLPSGAGAYSVSGVSTFTATTFSVRVGLNSASIPTLRWMAWP